MDFESAHNLESDRNVLRFGEGISPDDIELSLAGTWDLVLTIKQTGETVTLNWFYQTGELNTYNWYGDLHAIEFADGTVWDRNHIQSLPVHMQDNLLNNYADCRGSYLIGNARDNKLEGSKKDDILHGGDGDDYLAGNAGNDILHGDAGNDTLFGGDGDDTLHGGDGDDKLHGGAGDDILHGGAGNDVYVFGVGDGHDVVNDYIGSDDSRNVVRLGEGLGVDDVELLVSKTVGQYSDVIIRIKSTGETLTIKDNIFYNGATNYYGVQAIEFADGTVWDREDLAKQILHIVDGETGPVYADYNGSTIMGNDLNNAIYGHKGNDVLSGGGGDDVLHGGDGNDILHGGAGNDTLNGGYGNDVYLFGIGDGHDVVNDYLGSADNANIVRLGDGLGVDDIELFVTKATRGYSDVIIRIKSTGETLTIKDNIFYNGATNYYGVQAIEFADGTVWDREDLAKQTLHVVDGETGIVYADYNGSTIMGNDLNNTIYGNKGNDVLSGGGGDDVLYGYDGDDVLHGGAGNDILSGSYGNDTYLFGRGDGQDTIQEYTGDDSLLFGEGIAADDLWFSRTGYDLVVDVLGSDDKVTIKDWFYNTHYQVESISAGGMEIANSQMDQMLQAIASFGVEQGFGGQWTQEQKEQANAAVLGGYWRPTAS